MNIFYLMFKAWPSEKSDDFDQVGGAYINCWIKELDETSAREKAFRMAENKGWIVDTLEESYVVTRERYRDSPKSLQYFDQAAIDGECYVFHTWPSDPQEDDRIH
jgi:hypothetical protein